MIFGKKIIPPIIITKLVEIQVFIMIKTHMPEIDHFELESDFAIIMTKLVVFKISWASFHDSITRVRFLKKFQCASIL